MRRVFYALALIALGIILANIVHLRWEPSREPSPDNGQTAARAHTSSAQPPALTMPVLGVRPSALVDTFTQAREQGSRAHDALDILAPRGAPVVAAARGRIEKIFISERGGNTIYQRSADGNWIFYYAHLDGYSDGLREGITVSPGTEIGTVGPTGNANPEAPHLHFAVNRVFPGERWYEGRPVNPYPMLTHPAQ